MPVILWIPGFPEAHDYRVAVVKISSVLCINIPKLINYLRMLKGNRWPLPWTSVQCQIQSRNLAIVNMGALVLPSSRGTSENLQFWVSPLPPAGIMTDWILKISDAQRARARERRDNLGPGVSLGTCEVFSWLEGGTREGPAKFVLGRLLVKDSQSSYRNSQAPSSPLSEPASPQEAACPAMGRSGRLKLNWREKSVRHLLLLGTPTFIHSSGIPGASRKWIRSKHGAWSRDGERIYTRSVVVQITFSNESGLQKKLNLFTVLELIFPSLLSPSRDTARVEKRGGFILLSSAVTSGSSQGVYRGGGLVVRSLQRGWWCALSLRRATDWLLPFLSNMDWTRPILHSIS